MAHGVLLERDVELETVKQLAGEALQSRGRVALIEAPAGLGKTALLAECIERLSTRGLLVLRARGSDLETEFPWGIVRGLFEHQLADREIRADVLVGAAARAAPLFDDSMASADVDAGAGDRSSYPMLHALYWLVANLCRRLPIALVVDDAHEADDNSLQFLTYLASRTDELPLLILIGARPPAHVPGRGALERLKAEQAIEHIAITPLSLDAIAAFVSRRMNGEPDLEFASACRVATGGNPFYLGELLRDLRERNISPTSSSAASISDVTPPTIVRSLLFRLAAVGGPALSIVRAAAVLGDGSPLGLCAQLAGVGADAAAFTADELVKATIINPGKEIVFAHPILRGAVLADLGTHERARWHARAAALLIDTDNDPQAIAVHLLRTEPGASRVTVDILRRAADVAVRTGSPGTAADYLVRAIAEPPQDDVLETLVFELGVAQAAVGHTDGIANVMRGTAASTVAPLRVSRALTLAEIQLRSGHFEGAMATLDQARPYLDEVEEDLALRVAAARHWVGRQTVNTYPAARTGWDELHPQLAGPPSAARRELAVYLALDAVNVLSYAESSAMLDLGLSARGPLESVGPDSFVIVAALLALHALERHDDFDHLANAALVEAGRRGAMLGYVHVSTMRSHELYLRGRLDEAEAEVDAAVRAAAPRGWEFVAPGLTAIRAIIALERSRFDEVDMLIAQSAGDCEDPQDFPTGLLLDIRGVMRMSTGALAEGLADVLRCGELMESLGVVNPGIVPWRSHAALGHLAMGRPDAAHDLARADLALAQRMSGPVAIGGAQRVLGLVTDGDDGIDLLRASVETLATTPARVEEARALVDLGAVLRRSGKRLAAREPLQQGLDLAAAAGSADLVARAREEMLASGFKVHPRRPRIDELTPSEVRVARLAATGMSNSAIAQSLFVTRKTVEKHLANTYRKLGIRSKTELDASRLDRATGTDRRRSSSAQ